MYKILTLSFCAISTCLVSHADSAPIVDDQSTSIRETEHSALKEAVSAAEQYCTNCEKAYQAAQVDSETLFRAKTILFHNKRMLMRMENHDVADECQLVLQYAELLRKRFLVAQRKHADQLVSSEEALLKKIDYYQFLATEAEFLSSHRPCTR